MSEPSLTEKLFSIISVNEFELLAVSAFIAAVTSTLLPVYLRIIRRFLDQDSNRKKEPSEEVAANERATSNSKQLADKLAFERRRLGELKAKIAHLTTQQIGYEKQIKEPELWLSATLAARNRLMAETDRLRDRATSNLVFGVAFSLFSIFALVVLLFTLPSSDTSETLSGFLIDFIPRLTIVILLQIVATFFLKMHAGNETAIERNKHEITNVEMKLISISVASSDPALTEQISSLMKEDRVAVNQSTKGTWRNIKSSEVERAMNIATGLVEKIPKPEK